VLPTCKVAWPIGSSGRSWWKLGLGLFFLRRKGWSRLLLSRRGGEAEERQHRATDSHASDQHNQQQLSNGQPSAGAGDAAAVGY